MIITEVNIQNYRSIAKLKIKVDKNLNLITVCGANNVGKTNFLRALDLFFSLDKEKFKVHSDIPFHIAEGSRGAGYKTSITVKFKKNKDNYSITTIYTRKNKKNVLILKGKKNKNDLSEKEIKDFIDDYRFIYLESSNIDYSKKISKLVIDEVLLSLDKLRRRQSKPLEILGNFIDESKNAVIDIEDKIGKVVETYVNEIEGIDSKTWKIKIKFPEFNLLREAISGLIYFTLFDTNDREIDTKGSGIQKILLYSIIDYISEEAKKKGKTIVWGIDEPEAFLQPALQKKTFKKLKEYSKNYQIFLATHSHFFVDLENTTNVHLFESDKELKEFKRKQGKLFYKVNTFLNDKTGIEKSIAIRNNFGIERNDGWEILPYNLLVEGDDDKKYLIEFCKIFEMSVPNIFVANGVSKMRGYLQFLNDYSNDLNFKPKIVCILDHDMAGKIGYSELSSKRFSDIDLTLKHMPRCDGAKDNSFDYEIEDFIYPEFIVKAVNKFLNKKHYNKVKKVDLSKRFLESYNKENILKFITEIVKHNNPDKGALNFEDLSIKKFISHSCCQVIGNLKNEEFEQINNKYPSVREFIKEITTFN